MGSPRCLITLALDANDITAQRNACEERFHLQRQQYYCIIIWLRQWVKPFNSRLNVVKLLPRLVA